MKLNESSSNNTQATDSYRSHSCGQLNEAHVETSVVLSGWVHKRRNLGGVIFIDLRDRYGLTQVVFNPEQNSDLHELAEHFRNEDVIQIQGLVRARPQGMVNKNMLTGGIEVEVSAAKLLSKAKTPPFLPEQIQDVSETLRLKHRYLDLRRPEMQKRLIIRHKMNQSLRTYLNNKDFVDVETPILTRATPEGARDYLVPSRVHPGQFFALPQSPQLFKQLLMVAGMDKYYQIARCFRDEDLRADRQPEFTQLDIEMSFVEPQGIYNLVEGLMQTLWQDVLEEKLPPSFQKMSYHQAISEYGSDKPDLRWPIPMKLLNSIFEDSEFRVFSEALSQGGEIRAFKIPGAANMSRNQLDQLTKTAQHHGAKGLVWFKFLEDGLKSSIDKFVTESEKEAFRDAMELAPDDLALLISGSASITRAALLQVKASCIEKLELAPKEKYSFVWITDFPLLEYSEEDGRYYSMHHPFTHPHPDDLEKMKQKDQLSQVRALAYDLVLNGFEIGGGSIRIHDSELQSAMFDLLDISKREAQEKFGFFLEALAYGTPPHGGIAFGLDRLAMILSQTHAIRDVIAFPKTQNASDLMCEAPADVPEKSLQELFIQVKNVPNAEK